jgi:hypothetical protein
MFKIKHWEIGRGGGGQFLKLLSSQIRFNQEIKLIIREILKRPKIILKTCQN